MGKSQKKRSMRRHNPMRVPDSHLPKGLASASATSSKNEAILPIIQKASFPLPDIQLPSERASRRTITKMSPCFFPLCAFLRGTSQHQMGQRLQIRASDTLRASHPSSRCEHLCEPMISVRMCAVMDCYQFPTSGPSLSSTLLIVHILTSLICSWKALTLQNESGHASQYPISYRMILQHGDCCKAKT